MHDIRAIREAPETFDAALARRGLAPLSSEILTLDEARRACIQAAEAALADRNAASKEVGRPRHRATRRNSNASARWSPKRKTRSPRWRRRPRTRTTALRDLLSGIPNLPYDDVPDGADEDDNVEIHRWGTPARIRLPPKEHFELTGIAPGMDFETAAKLSGSRFVLMSGAVARLHRALAQFMLDIHTEENGLTEVNGPVLVRPEVMYGTGQLPKFGEDSYETTNGWWLIPTSEVSLTNIVAGHIVDEDYLPRRYTAHSLCFRSEAGSAGRDTAGMLRQHQFEKVEMVSVTHPDASDDEQKRMLRCAEGILETLGLPYRTVVLCTGDMGFGARRTYDIEVWLPGQNTYREISSVSTCGDFRPGA
jgi:seryl-tRNA synthetase